MIKKRAAIILSLLLLFGFQSLAAGQVRFGGNDEADTGLLLGKKAGGISHVSVSGGIRLGFDF